jgi:hypothetical protein
VAIPTEMWAPLGAITAALIAGFISLVNLLIAKDQKITEFRQIWIDSLRKEVATLASLATAISSLRHVIDVKQNKLATRDDALNDMSALLKGEEVKRSECRNRILLLLNPKDDRDLVLKINELYEASSISSDESHHDVLAKCAGVLSEAQVLLKKEWRRVKRGEPVYVAMKIIVALVVLALALIAVISTKSFWSNSLSHF